MADEKLKKEQPKKQASKVVKKTVKKVKTEKKKTTVKKKPVAKKTPVTKKTPAKKQKTAPKANETPIKNETPKVGGFFEDAAENMEEGVKIVGEKATQIADKTSKFAKDIFEKVKKGVSEAYDTGVKIAEQLSETAQEYAEKYKNVSAIRRLKSEKGKILKRLGAIVYEKSQDLKKDNSLLVDEDMRAIIRELNAIDDNIVEIGKKLDEAKKP